MICWTREIADLELICSLLRDPISCKVRERELLLHKILGWIDWFLLSYTHQMEQVLNGCELPSCAWYQAFFWMYSNRYSWIISLFYFFLFIPMLSFIDQGWLSSQELFSFHVCGLYGASLFSLLLLPSIATSWESPPVISSWFIFIELCYFICCFPLILFIMGKHFGPLISHVRSGKRIK